MADEKKRVDDIKASAQRIWLAGLGALSMAEEEGGKLFRNLVEKGADFEARGSKHSEAARQKAGEAWGGAREKVGETLGGAREKVEETLGDAREKVGDLGASARERVADAAGRVKSGLGSSWNRVEERVDQAVQGAFERSGVPTREEIAVLSTRIEELTRLVGQLKSDAEKA